ncbi:DNA replication and repair protein RecF [Luminiphilus syltensis NOR5-1B]|uniref:DNA replication and repair protein RecF n=1 Tax=Luminiphilus syltensis NOR5-1B TaxID=565045 RepID=B8KUE9_9GAMM|nr:DNA replication/repair protein RecF [Luminiphilus syltensis]EED35329.1 DNA replication and repair protein RecF [Luminiphilus syltensis NOR5-1B]
MIKQLAIEGVRNLDASVSLGSSANLLYGRNGSGKTSVLEAIHLLAVGRSFRANSAKPVIGFDRDHCLVTATVTEGNRNQQLGIQRSKDGSVIARINGEAVTSLAMLAEVLPVVVMDSGIVSLIDGQPEGRRRFIDASVFHVEQSFLPAWRRFQRALRQRNAGLRRGTLEGDEAWRREVASAGQKLTEMRSVALDALQARFVASAEALSDDIAGMALVFRAGWDKTVGLLEALERSLESDRLQGFTHVGPHRADIKLLIDGRPAAEVMSRGQLKLAATALKLAQGGLIAQQSRSTPVYLVDDLLAELDSGHSRAVCDQLVAAGGQVVFTAVDRDEVPAFWSGSELTLFHVEQGSVVSV